MVSSIFKIQTRYQPSLLAGSLILIFSLLAGLSFLAWIVFLPLLVPPVSAFCTMRFRPKAGVSITGKRGTLILGYCMIALLFATGVYDTVRYYRMDRVDFLVSWRGGTFLGRNLVSEMKEEGQAALPDLRRLIRENPACSPCYDAFSALSEIGEPNKDVPLVLAAYKQLILTEHDSWIAYEAEKALRTLTGLDLPEGTSPEEWEIIWAAVQSGPSTDTQTGKSADDAD